MSNWQTQQSERNNRSLARLTKYLPEIFPPAVLSRALSRPFIPPTPRLAIDSYWRAHPLRADRLARALAARSGAPKGGSLEAIGKAAYRSHSERRPLRIENAPIAWVLDSAACAASPFIALVGMLICGTEAQT
jgi:hypothetical protein